MNLFGDNREQRLISLFGKGDARAMDELYSEYADYLAGVCSRYVQNKEDLHDVLQECFIKIFTKIATFEYRGKGSLKAWVTRVAINEALHFLRDNEASMWVDWEVEPPALHEEEPGVDGLSVSQITELILRLPPGYRAVFNLFAIEGKSHKEIAQLLNIKADTSASQFHRAKNMLAKMIKEQQIWEERR